MWVSYDEDEGDTVASKSVGNIQSSIFINKIESSIINELENKVKEIEDEMIVLIQSDEAVNRNFKLVTSITGIGKITAIELIVCTENFKKLDTAKKVAAYAGVCPYPNQSGNIYKRSKTHFRANKKLKSLLYMCAKTICAHNKEYKLYRERKMIEGKHFFLVMNNIANKLLRTVYAVIESGEPFDPNYMRNDPRLEVKKV